MSHYSEGLPQQIDPTMTYQHPASGFRGKVEDWVEDPDGKLRVRINDHWLFFDELEASPEVEDPADLPSL